MNYTFFLTELTRSFFFHINRADRCFGSSKVLSSLSATEAYSQYAQELLFPNMDTGETTVSVTHEQAEENVISLL